MKLRCSRCLEIQGVSAAGEVQPESLDMCEMTSGDLLLPSSHHATTLMYAYTGSPILRQIAARRLSHHHHHYHPLTAQQQSEEVLKPNTYPLGNAKPIATSHDDRSGARHEARRGAPHRRDTYLARAGAQHSAEELPRAPSTTPSRAR